MWCKAAGCPLSKEVRSFTANAEVVSPRGIFPVLHPFSVSQLFAGSGAVRLPPASSEQTDDLTDGSLPVGPE